MKVLSELIPVDIPCKIKSYGQDIISLLWKPIVINILGPVISAKFMLIRYMYLLFL